ncbi:hypothetical protein H4217_003690 [Coemansia sp. RSA 1939]|nr:hypothetical protein H4217_003690 [Coemansia sp. RSA 1939]KAJ2611606.1 hypothetical protein EV177_003413 [Coemansia sp. RSA 1804]
MPGDSFDIPCFVPSRLDGCVLEALVTVNASADANDSIGAGAAVVYVHPYPPLGGQFRNNVIYELRSRLDQRAAVSVALNLRGAGGSGGKTSWTGLAEREDICSVLDMLRARRLLLHPLRHSAADRRLVLLRMQARGLLPPDADVDSMDSVPLPLVSRTLLCGYSYGSVIASSVSPADYAPLGIDFAYISFPYSVLWLLVLYKRSWYLAHISATVADAAVAFVKQQALPPDAVSTGAHVSRTLFIAGTADSFTSLSAYNKWWELIQAKSILALQALQPPVAPDAAIHAAAKALALVRVPNADHAWLRREGDISDAIEAWWWQ